MDDLYNHLRSVTHEPESAEAYALQLIKDGVEWSEGLIRLKRVWYLTQEEAELVWDAAAEKLRYSTSVQK